MTTRKHVLTTLSFAANTHNGGTVNLWLPFDEGDIAKANTEGRRRADELLQFMEAQSLPFLLGHVVCAMIGAARYGPLEIGFTQRVAEYAMAGELPGEGVEIVPDMKPKLSLVPAG